MSGWTNKGKFRVLDWGLRGVAPPTTFYVALFTDAVAPSPDINTKGQLTEIATGNGYTAGGIAVNNDTTDFDTATEDDTNDRGFVQIKDLVWSASGGPLPASGNGARYAALTDDNATQDNREVFFFWDLGGEYSVSAGQTLTLNNPVIEINES